MNRGIAFATLCVALLLGSAGNANAFFGCLGGGCGDGCCEPSCGCEEPSCCCEAPCSRPCCPLLGGLRGMFNRHNNCCCEASCCCEEASCAAEATCAAEPSCGCAEASCCCEEPCCRPRCPLLGCLKGMFNRGCCCESSCCEEASCGCDSGCGCN